MAIPKVCGIETEYGVVLRGAADPNPVLASSMLINSYVEHHKVGWDFEDESPGRDARGFAREGALPPEVETHLVNTVLTNGSRYYVDHAHPEYSTPECSDALELVCADKAGERILARSMHAARRLLEPGQEIVVYKNNSDGKGNSYGTHENYLVDRSVPFAALVRNLLPWFVTRQVFTGAGKVGAENGAGARRLPDQPARRLLRGGGRARDHAEAPDREHARRAARRSAAVPPAARDRRRREPVRGRDVPQGRHHRDRARDDRRRLHRQGPVDRRPGRRDAHGVARPHVPRHGRRSSTAGASPRSSCSGSSCASRRSTPTRPASRCCGGDDVGGQVLARWEAALARARTRSRDARRPTRLGHEARAARARTSTATGSSGPTRSCRCSTSSTTTSVPTARSTSDWCGRARSSAWSTRKTSIEAMTEPPATTRAYFRGECLAHWPDAVVAANWDSVILDVGSDPCGGSR